MVWPNDQTLPTVVWAAFGADLTAHPATWVWTDLTSRLLPVPIPIRRGASDGASVVSPGTGVAVLKNDDGALTPKHPLSPYYPNVDLNTPVMLGLTRPNRIADSDSFSTPSSNSLGVSDQGRTWQTISAGGTISASDYQVSGGAATLSVPAANAYRSGWLALGVADVDVVCTVSGVAPTGAAIEPGNIMLRIQDSTHYYLFRLSVTPGGVIQASIHANGSTGQLATVTVPGLTWSASTPYRVRAQAWGTWLRMKVWLASGPEPDAWTLTAESAEYLVAGGVGVRCGVAFGNTNTKPVVFTVDDFAAVEMPAIRLDGFADSWEPTYTPTVGGEVVSSIRLTASGLLRRLGQGVSPQRSAYQRTIEATVPGPLA